MRRKHDPNRLPSKLRGSPLQPLDLEFLETVRSYVSEGASFLRLQQPIEMEPGRWL